MSAESDDFDLQAAWDQACQSFARTAEGKCDLKNVDLKKGPPGNPSPQQVLDQIAASKAKDEEKKAKYRTARDVIDKSLKCVQLLGGIAAQAASSAFPASGMCWNAVSYLISAGQNYSKIFQSLEELFSRISEVLERCVVYLQMDKRDLDLPLRKIIFRLLLSFASICELSIKVLHENRVKKFLKVIAFSDDEGVMAEYDKLRNLCDNELQMKSTLTYQTVKQSQRSLVAQSETLQGLVSNVADISAGNQEGFKTINSTLENIEKSQRDRDSDKVRKGQREKVEKAIGNDRSKNERAVFESLRNAKVEGTGSWLQDQETYQAWTRTQDQVPPILLLSGKEGFGKSFLTVSMIQDLLKKKGHAHDRDLQRVLVAYVFIGRESADDRGRHKETRPVADAVASIAWQLCEDQVFLKDFSTSFDESKSFDSSDNDQILSIFNKVLESLKKTASTCYILLDGVDQLDEKREFGKYSKLLAQMLHISDTRQHLSELKPPSQVLPTREEYTIDARNAPITRVMCSATPSVLAEFAEGLESQTLDVSPGNAVDVDAFINDRISEMKIAKGQSDDIKELRASMPQQLLKITEGDFKNLEMLLDQISLKQRPSEIREALETARSGATRTDTIEREIQQLNDTLSNEDIRDLNELLLWALGSYKSMTAAELEAALYLQNREANFTSLVERVRTRFSVLFGVESMFENPNDAEATIQLKSGSHKEFFTEISEKQAASRKMTSGNIFASEIRMMRRVLRQFCDDELYEKFGFEAFLQQKATPDSVISISIDDQHIRLLKRCLQILREPEQQDTLDPLRAYSLSWFADHLVAVDLSLSDPLLKSEVGELLIPLFTSETAIAQWWDSQATILPWEWMSNDEDTYINGLSAWFRDSAVTKLLDEDTKEVARQLALPTKTPIEFMYHIAKHMGTRWMKGPWNRGNPVPFAFVYLYLSKQRVARNAGELFPMADSVNPLPTAALILECRDWVLEQLEQTEPDAEDIRQTARIYREYSLYDEAIKAFQHAASSVENNWLFLDGLAETYFMQGAWAEAIEVYKPLIEKLSEGKASTYNGDDPVNHLQWNQLRLGQCFVKIGELQKGLDIFQEILKEQPKNWDVIVEVIRIRRQRAEYSAIIEFLQEIKKDENFSTDGGTYFNQVFWFLCYRDDYHEAVFEAARQTDSINFVKESYDGAVSAARTLNRTRTYDPRAQIQILGNLLYFTASFLFEHPLSPTDESDAIVMWEEIVHLANHHNQASAIETVKDNAVKKLCSAYIELAKDEEYASPAATGHLEKLETLASDDTFGETSFVDVHLLLCRYLSLMNQHEQARTMVRGHLKIAFDLLSNEDPSDDWVGFHRMGIVFNFLGQDANALAAFSLITPLYIKYNNSLAQQKSEEAETKGVEADGDHKEEKENEQAEAGKQEVVASPEASPKLSNGISDPMEKPEESSTKPSKSEDEKKPATLDDGPLGYGCDGLGCERSWTYMSDIYHCRDCLDVAFCDEHMKEAKDGRRYGTCKGSHAFLYVPPYRQEAVEKVGPTNVQVGEKVVPIDDWLSDLRKEWDFEESQTSS